MERINLGITSLHYSSNMAGNARSSYMYERKGFDQRIDEFVEKLDQFLVYNPEYQIGLVQIGVSAKHDVGSYRVGVKEYIENMLVSRTPEKGTDIYVANLNEVCRRAGAVRRARRASFCRTYYIEKENGICVPHLLYDNNEWLDFDKVKETCGWLTQKEHGTIKDEKPVCYQLKTGSITDVAIVVLFKDRKGDDCLWLTFVNSGTILRRRADEVNLIAPCRKPWFRTELLRFEFVLPTLLKRCGE